MPKSNLYQSIHTSVIGPSGRPIEIQIRTKEMHKTAEYGIGAHWKYKETGVQKVDSDGDKKISWLRQLIEENKDITDAKEFINNVKLDLFSDEIFVFTPNGDVISIPKGSTPIDFAYKVHTSIGNRCNGAKINHNMVQLNTEIKSGDLIEVLTTNKENSNLDWVKFVKTHHAKTRIRQWHRKNKKEFYISQGKAGLEEVLTRNGFEEHLKAGDFTKISDELNFKTEEELFASIGYGENSVQKIINKLEIEPVEKTPKNLKFQSNICNSGIIGLDGMLHQFAKCCSPIPGESIVGIVTQGKGLSIHKKGCHNLDSISKEKIIQIDWDKPNKIRKYQTHLRIDFLEKMGVLKDILGRIADKEANVVFANAKTVNKNHGIADIGIQIIDISQLNIIIQHLRNMKEITTEPLAEIKNYFIIFKYSMVNN